MSQNSSETKKDLRQLSTEELATWFKEKNQTSFRAKQVQEWLWKKSCVSIDEMTNLPLSLRELLKDNFEIRNVKLEKKQISQDKTIKNTFRLADNHLVEGVLIPTKKG